MAELKSALSGIDRKLPVWQEIQAQVTVWGGRARACAEETRAWVTANRHHLEGPRAFLMIIAATLLLLILWAGLAEVDRIVRVEGRIIPAGRNQQIQHLEGGIVASIAVAEGGAVAKGDLLLTIDGTSAGANMGETSIKLASERIRAARLDAEANNQPQLSLPPELAALPAAEFERQLFRSRRTQFQQEITVYQQQVGQKNAELREVQVKRQRLAGEIDTAQQRLTLTSSLVAKNAASQLEVLEAQSRLQRLSTELGEAEGAVPKLVAAVGEAEARIQKALATYRSEAQADQIKSLAEIERLQQILTAQSDRVTRTEVRAPVAGIVNRIAVNTVGGVVKPGDTIVEITPTTEKVVIEARSRPGDRGELRSGLDANVRISAYDVGALGVLAGRVTEVSADTVTDAKGDSYFRVAIEVQQIPESYAGKLIVPGMTTTGDVVIGKRSVLSYLMSPVTKFTYNAFRDPR